MKSFKTKHSFAVYEVNAVLCLAEINNESSFTFITHIAEDAKKCESACMVGEGRVWTC